MKSAIEFHGNGKLLISGEYLVLAGAMALAMPVRFGQQMVLHEINSRMIDWKSSTPDGIWFSARFDPDTLTVISANQPAIAFKLNKLLSSARRLNPGFLTGATGWDVDVTANYPLEWGLGSSSTLCFMVADWAEVNVFDLFRLTSNGSGYDIACAGRKGLLYYQLCNGQPEITDAQAGKALRENAWFAYLGSKQDSASEVEAFLANHHFSELHLAEISQLSTAICGASSTDELIPLIYEHEVLLSSILKKPPIASRFRAFPGAVKSLGAWGGDFAMFVSWMEPEEVKNHLCRLGLTNFFSFHELEIAP
ncbi:MAG: GYDIA family GHMP kinase [Bacteroidota bacterium]